MIEIVHVKKGGLSLNPGVTYIGREGNGFRGSVLGNPFPMPKYTRDECVALYKKWLWGHIQSKDVIYDELMKLVVLHKSGKNLKLGCWCAPLGCHGDIVKSAILYLEAL